MLTPEIEPKSEDVRRVSEQPLRLSLVRGGLAEVVLVGKELMDSEQARTNLIFLAQHGAEIDKDELDSGRVVIGVDKRQGALICGLLRVFEVTGLERFPGRVHVVRPDTYEAIHPFLKAKREGRAEVNFSDGRLALGYVQPQQHDGDRGIIFIENRNGSENNGLFGAPKEVLKQALDTFNLAKQVEEIKESLRYEKARSHAHEGSGIMIPGDSRINMEKMQRG